MKKIRNGIMAAVAAGASVATLGCTTSCSKMYTTPRKIADYLHEITYTDYREDTEYETISEAEAFGCSSVRCGNFYGRNFDYIYNDTPEFITHVKANKEKNRHESLAVCTHFGLREQKLKAGKYNKQLELIPNLAMDGINDAGVICSSNVVSMEPNKEEGITPETNPHNPNAKNLHVLFIVRFVLDNATSAENAVELLSSPSINIMGNLKNEMNLHVMIADKNDTYIVEFFKKTSTDHFDVVAQKKSDDVSNPTSIMTNYYCNISSTSPEFTNDEKFGNERYEILKWLYPKTAEEKSNFNMDSMARLLKSVQFSQAYKRGKPIEPLGKGGKIPNCEWYSEKIKQSVIDDYEDPLTEEWKTIIKNLENLKLAYEMKVREEANPSYWITTHNSTYEWDWENKVVRLRVYVQEDYEHPHNYELKIG